MGRGRFGGGRGSELLLHLLHRHPYHLCIDCDSLSLPSLGLTAACQVCRQHWRPNHQLQTLSHCMSLDSRAESQLHCSTVRHRMTPCTNPSPDTRRERYTLMHTPNRRQAGHRNCFNKLCLLSFCFLISSKFFWHLYFHFLVSSHILPLPLQRSY